MGFRDDDERNEAVQIDEVEVRANSAKALLCRWDDNEEWIPKSLLHRGEIDEDSKRGFTGTLSIPRWKADKIGWEASR